MPLGSGLFTALRLSILHLVGDTVCLWIAGQQIFGEDMCSQRAKTAAEVDMLLRRNILIVKHHDAV